MAPKCSGLEVCHQLHCKSQSPLSPTPTHSYATPVRPSTYKSGVGGEARVQSFLGNLFSSLSLRPFE